MAMVVCGRCRHNSSLKSDDLITPPPVGGRGIVFGRFLSFFLSLSATLRENGRTDSLIRMKFSGKVWRDHGTT